MSPPLLPARHRSTAMKRRLYVIVLTVAAGALGFVVGRWSQPEAPDPRPSTAINRPATAPDRSPAKADSVKDAAAVRENAVNKFAALGTKVSTMSPEEFGQRYAELLTGTSSEDNLLERAAMVAALTPERTVACYLAYKNRVGVGLKENTQDIRHILTVAGERDGASVIAAMQKAAPGFQELSSLLHGWAMKDPGSAVEWYNNLPDGDAQRKTALDGLMWGLSLRDAATTRKVYLSLSPEDQVSSGRSLGRAIYTSGGGAELNQLIAGLPPDAAQECLRGACGVAVRRTPSESVPWLATHLGNATTADRAFLESWIRWTVSDPDAAEKWRAAQSNARVTRLIEAAQQEPAP